jgi:hypothetical protein
MAAEVTSKVVNSMVPGLGPQVYILTYTKTGITDTVVVSTYTPIKSIIWAKAMIDADGSDDPITSIASGTVTLSTGTGAGRVMVVGTGQ